MAETRPRRGFREVRPLRDTGAVGGGLAMVKEGTISMCVASNAFQAKKGTGNVSGVVLKSVCPRSQNSARIN